ncbi:MAG: hypothetical protein WBV43_15725, partial [Pseudolabrys sp.]
ERFGAHVSSPNRKMHINSRFSAAADIDLCQYRRLCLRHIRLDIISPIRRQFDPAQRGLAWPRYDELCKK